jgi:hypothetical protein
MPDKRALADAEAEASARGGVIALRFAPIPGEAAHPSQRDDDDDPADWTPYPVVIVPGRDDAGVTLRAYQGDVLLSGVIFTFDAWRTLCNRLT